MAMIVFLLLHFVGGWTAHATTSEQCTQHLTGRVVLPAELFHGPHKLTKSAMERLANFSPDFVFARRAPTRIELGSVENAITALEIARVAGEPIESHWKNLEPYLLKHSAIYRELEKREAELTPLKDVNNDYTLKAMGQASIKQLNRLLPERLRIPTHSYGAHPKESKRRALGEKISRQQKENLWKARKNSENLFASSGFGSLEALDHALLNAGPEARTLRDMIAGENVRVGLASPSQYRGYIEAVGFKSIHFTNTSRGNKNPVKRVGVEAALLELRADEYAALDPEVKPIYGALFPPEKSGLKEPDLSGYGDDIYLFNISHIRDRLTWSVGDSNDTFTLNHIVKTEPKKSDDLKWEHEPTSWDQILNSWESRLLIVPSLLKAAANGEDLLLPATETNRSPSLKNFRRSWRPFGGYIEFQIWVATLDDVNGFIFKGLPPEGPFLESLRKRNIRIYDGRGKGEPIPWEP